MAKMILSGIAAVLVALLAGFLWGASGRSTIERALERSELRNELLEARGAALAARVDIYNTNFGEASRHLEEARASVTRAVQRLERLDREEEMQLLQSAQGPDRGGAAAGQQARSRRQRPRRRSGQDARVRAGISGEAVTRHEMVVASSG